MSSQDESSGDGLIRQEALCDPDLDAQLESLRNKLIAVTTIHHVASLRAIVFPFCSPPALKPIFLFDGYMMYRLRKSLLCLTMSSKHQKGILRLIIVVLGLSMRHYNYMSRTLCMTFSRVIPSKYKFFDIRLL